MRPVWQSPGKVGTQSNCGLLVPALSWEGLPTGQKRGQEYSVSTINIGMDKIKLLSKLMMMMINNNYYCHTSLIIIYLCPTYV